MENSPGPGAVTNFPKALQDRASALRAPRAGVDWMPSNRGARRANGPCAQGSPGAHPPQTGTARSRRRGPSRPEARRWQASGPATEGMESEGSAVGAPWAPSVS